MYSLSSEETTLTFSDRLALYRARLESVEASQCECEATGSAFSEGERTHLILLSGMVFILQQLVDTNMELLCAAEVSTKANFRSIIP